MDAFVLGWRRAEAQESYHPGGRVADTQGTTDRRGRACPVPLPTKPERLYGRRQASPLRFRAALAQWANPPLDVGPSMGGGFGPPHPLMSALTLSA